MIRIIVRVTNYAEGEPLHSLRTFDIEAAELEAFLRRRDYSTRSHGDVIGAEVLSPAQQENSDGQ